MKVDVLIFYEHINRELESAIFLKQRLEDKGYSAHVVHVGWEEGLAKLRYQPKLIVTPWCYDEKDMENICTYKSASSSGKLKLLNIHCEQITNDVSIQFMLPSGKAKEIYHIAWGEYFKEKLMAVGVKEERICVAGSSRLDFFRKECSEINKSKLELALEYSLNKTGKWMLLVGNFSTAFCTEEAIASLEERGCYSIREEADLSKRTYAKVLEWFDVILEQYSNKENSIEFIYRPHPSEPVSDQLRVLEERYSNFHIIRDHSIRDWFVNCDAAFSWNSTSAVEGAMAEIPMYALRPIPIPLEQAVSILESVQKIVDVDQFKDAIKASIEKRDNHVNDKFRTEVDYYYSIHEELATDLTVAFIESILTDDGEADVDSCYTIDLALRKCVNYGIKLFLYKCSLMSKVEKFKVLGNEYLAKDHYNSYVDKVRRIRS